MGPRAGTIARLVYDSRYGPVALPFEYQMHQGSIVFRTYRTLLTEEDLRTGIRMPTTDVAVEIDQTDPGAREGWIVIVWGAAHNVDTEAERGRSPASISSRGSRGNPSTSSG